MEPSEPRHLLTPKQTAEILGIGVQTLAHWRLGGKGPRYVKTGRVYVRYDPTDVERWIEAQKVTPARESAIRSLHRRGSP